MPANVELKARVIDPLAFEDRLRAIYGAPVATLEQEDIFFAVPRGRLKMRCEGPQSCELIYYRRKNEAGPAFSSYFRSSLQDPEKKKNELASRFGLKGIVQKKRQLFMAKGSRIHLDEVTGIGHFVEIEVPVISTGAMHQATVRAMQLMRELLIDENSLIDSAYEELRP